MLRPARSPCPPDWLRRDEVTCASPRLLRCIVTPASDAARCRTALGVRLDGRTGNLPSSGLSPDKSQQLVRLHDSRNKLPSVASSDRPGSLQLLIGTPPCFFFFHRQKGQLELFPFTSYSVSFFILSVLFYFFAQFTVAGWATASTNVANLLIL